MAVKKQDSNSKEQLHNNLSYYGGEWQLAASLSRPPVYMKESMLDLIMTESYDGSHQYTTRRLFGDTGGHRLSHDIILVDRTYYATLTSTQGSSSFTSPTTFAQYSIMAANPVYDRRSKPVIYPIIQKWQDNPYTIKDFFRAMDYVPASSVSGRHTAQVSNIDHLIAGRYLYSLSSTGKKEYNVTAQSTTIDNTSTFDSIYRNFYHEDGWYKDYGGKTIYFDKELWDKDYSLWFHDPDSIKLPFYDRHAAAGSVSYTATSITTRFNINMVSKAERTGGAIDTFDTDIEYIYSQSWSPEQAAQVFTNTEILNDLSGSGEGASGNIDILIKRLKEGDLKELCKKLNNDSTWEAQFMHRLAETSKIMAQAHINEPVEIYSSTNSDMMALVAQNQSEGFVVSGTANNAMSYLSSSTSKFNLFEGFFITAPFVTRFISRRTFIGKALGAIASQGNNLEKIAQWSFLEDPTDNITSSKITTQVNGTDPDGDPALYCNDKVVPVGLVILNALIKYIGKGRGISKADGNSLLFAGGKDTYVWSDVVGLNFDELDDKLIEWLDNEKIIVKAPMFSDYVENINFAQDLNEDAATTFTELTIKRSKDKVRLYEDSEVELPYLKQTRSLIDFNKADELPSHFSSSFTAVNTSRVPLIPSQFFDKDIDEASVDEIVHDERYTAKQQINPATGRATFEGGINSPSIDELWTYIKYLSEDVSADKLPEFTGITSDEFNKSYVTGVGGDDTKRRVNPRAGEVDKRVVDIIKWSPTSTEAGKFMRISGTSKTHSGYTVDEYIEKVFDYKVNFFGRRSTNLCDNAVYEFDEDTGYLESLLNGIATNFNVLNEDTDARDSKLYAGNDYDNDETLLAGKFEEEPTLFQPSEQRVVAAKVLDSIVNYHSIHAKHNHYATYKVNPKNLKTIERDLEQIKQNIMSLAEYTQNTYANMGYADRGINRGTLHQLHRNNFDFASTLIEDVNNTKAVEDIVKLAELTNGLNNTEDSLVVTDLDKKVVFDDGQYNSRYLHENYDRQVVDLSGAVKNTRAEHEAYRRNETLLSEVYLAADGTYRSVHEHLIAPILICQY